MASTPVARLASRRRMPEAAAARDGSTARSGGGHGSDLRSLGILAAFGAGPPRVVVNVADDGDDSEHHDGLCDDSNAAGLQCSFRAAIETIQDAGGGTIASPAHQHQHDERLPRHIGPGPHRRYHVPRVQRRQLRASYPRGFRRREPWPDALGRRSTVRGLGVDGSGIVSTGARQATTNPPRGSFCGVRMEWSRVATCGTTARASGSTALPVPGSAVRRPPSTTLSPKTNYWGSSLQGLVRPTQWCRATTSALSQVGGGAWQQRSRHLPWPRHEPRRSGAHADPRQLRAGYHGIFT